MQALNIQSFNFQSENAASDILKKTQKSDISFRDMMDSVKNDSARSNSASKTVAEKKVSPEKNNSIEKTAFEVPEEKVPAGDQELQAAVLQTSLPQENPAAQEISAAFFEASDLAVEEAGFSDAAKSSEFSFDLPEVTDSEMNYLRTFEEPVSFEEMIENAPEWNGLSTEEEKLSKIQTLASEEPEEFLAMMDIVSDEELTSDPQIESAVFADTVPENTMFQAAVSDNDDGNENNLDDFELSQVSEKILEPENKITIIDERSVEQKIADFEKLSENSNSQENSMEMSLSLSQGANENILSSNSQVAASDGSNFQQMLTQQIQQNAPDFVKAGNILLKDNNSGTINMNLKPEALGNVKISLEVADNVITGNITVHSKEAFEAFKQNLANLKQSFQESGFENAEFNLNLADNSSSQNLAQGEHRQTSEEFFSKQTYSDYVSGNERRTIETEPVQVYESGSSRQINIVA